MQPRKKKYWQTFIQLMLYKACFGPSTAFDVFLLKMHQCIVEEGIIAIEIQPIPNCPFLSRPVGSKSMLSQCVE